MKSLVFILHRKWNQDGKELMQKTEVHIHAHRKWKFHKILSSNSGTSFYHRNHLHFFYTEWCTQPYNAHAVSFHCFLLFKSCNGLVFLHLRNWWHSFASCLISLNKGSWLLLFSFHSFIFVLCCRKMGGLFVGYSRRRTIKGVFNQKV